MQRCEELRRDEEPSEEGREREERSGGGCEGGRKCWRGRTMEVECRLEFSSAACQIN